MNNHQPDVNTILASLEITASTLNSLRRQLISAGWTEEGAEAAIIAILEQGGSHA